jgi:hypothetical protein
MYELGPIQIEPVEVELLHDGKTATCNFSKKAIQAIGPPISGQSCSFKDQDMCFVIKYAMAVM